MQQAVPGKRFAVALSFPGEHRDFVEAVAEALAGELSRERVLYDQYYEAEFARPNLDVYLPNLYRTESDLIVIFLCPEYQQKRWCRLEWRSIKELIATVDQDRIMFVSFGNPGDLSGIGILSGDGYIDIRDRAPAVIAGLIRQRMGLPNQAPAPVEPRRPARREGNLRAAVGHFVGRETELEALAEAVLTNQVAVVTAVHGFGGMGKTELAVKFAHQYAGQFQAGLWKVDAEGRKELLPLLGDLAEALGIPVSADPQESASQRGRRVLAELKRRAVAEGGGAATLVLLDNVSEPELLAGPQLAALPQADWLRIVATTRLGEGELRARALRFVPIDRLAEADALALIEQHQRGPWSSGEDEAALQELVRELDGFTLAIEAVALYLGAYPVRPVDYLAKLRREGLTSTDELVVKRQGVAAEMMHREKQLGLVLDATLERLDPLSLLVLEYAALLPPDHVVWPWLRDLVEEREPEALRFEQGDPDPWALVQQRLVDLRLLTPSEDERVARLHRLVGAHLRRRLDEERVAQRRAEMQGRLFAVTMALDSSWRHHSDDLWQLEPLQGSLASWDAEAKGLYYGTMASTVGQIELTLGRLDRAEPFLQDGLEALYAVHQLDSESEEVALALAESLTVLADFLRTRGQQGDAERALEYLERSLTVRERLMHANPQLVEAARSFMVGLSTLADSLRERGQSGDAVRALGYCERSKELCEQLWQAQPDSAEVVRDLWVCLNKLGDFLVDRGLTGDAERALGYYERSLVLCEQLLEANGNSAEAARDLSVVCDRIADFLVKRGQAGDAERALGYYERSKALSEHLFRSNPKSTQAGRDLSVSFQKLAVFLVQRARTGDHALALTYLERSLAIHEQLRQDNPQSAQAARDLSMSLRQLADLLQKRGRPGDLERCLAYYERSLALREELLRANDQSAQAARDLRVGLIAIADFLMERAQAGDAERSRTYAERSLAIAERLSLANRQSALAARDVLIALERVVNAVTLQSAPEAALEALPYQQRALAIALELRDRHPESVYYGRTAVISLGRAARLAHRAGRPESEVHRYLRHNLALLRELRTAGIELDPAMQELYEELKAAYEEQDTEASPER